MGESSGMLAPEGDRVWSELRLFVLCIPFSHRPFTVPDASRTRLEPFYSMSMVGEASYVSRCMMKLPRMVIEALRAVIAARDTSQG